MATYRIQAPDGRTYSIDGPDGATREEVIDQIVARNPQAAFPPAPPPPQRNAGFVGSTVGTAEQMLGTSRTGLAALLGDPTQAVEQGGQRAQEIAQRTGEMASFGRLAERYQEEGLPGAARQVVADVPSGVGQALPSTGAAIAGGFAGARLGALAAGPVGGVVGGVIGAAGANWLPQFGENLLAQAEAQRERGEEVDPNLIKAGLAATGQSALEAGGAAIALGRPLIARILGRTTSKAQGEKKLLETAQRSLRAGAARGAARGAVAEMPVEIAQTVIERYQAGQELLDDDAYEDYAEAAYLGGIGGAGIGAGASPMNRSAARGELEQRGVDPMTGEQVTSPEVDQARLEQLRQEQDDVRLGQERRELERQALAEEEAERAAQEGEIVRAYAQPVDLLRPDNQLQAELDQLRAEGFASPQLDRRIKRIEDELKERGVMRELPVDEDARRAQISARELRKQPPAIRARDAAATLLRGQLADVDTAVLSMEHERLKAEYNDLSDDQKVYYNALNAEMQDRRRDQRAQAREERELNRLRRVDEANRLAEVQQVRENLPQSLRADVVGESNLPPVFSPDVLKDAGLPRTAKYTKDLEGLDLTDPAQRDTAADIIQGVMDNQRTAQATKDRLQALILRPQFQGIDFTPRPVEQAPTAEPLTPATAPIAPMSPEIFDALGIGRTAKMRQDNNVLQLDPADPAQRAQLAETLEDYANNPLRSAALSDRIMDYVDRLRAVQQGEPDATTQQTSTESVDGTERGPDSPSMEVARPSVEPTAGPTTAGPVSATQPELPGLDDTGDSTGQTTAVESGTDDALTSVDATTPEFDRWFGDSKVVDSFGNPLVVYHGTTRDFTAFDKGQLQSATGDFEDSKIGFFFTNDPTAASVFATPSRSSSGGNVMPTYLSIQNPLVVDLVNEAGGPEIYRDTELFRAISDALGQRFNAMHEGSGDAVLAALRDAGYDGLHVINSKFGKLTPARARRAGGQPTNWDVFVALEPNQIKSAIGNQGTFDANSNDVVQVVSEAYTNNSNAGDLAGSTSPEFLAAVNEGNLQGALETIRDNAGEGFNSIESLVAQRMLDGTQSLPNIEIVDALPDRGGQHVSGQYNAVTDTIQLVRGEADSHTLLHEMTHAFTHRFLVRQQEQGYSDPHAKALVDLYAHVRRMMPDADAYGLTNVSEFAAEAFSNPEFQMRLMGIPYRQQTVWSWFTDALRRLFGMGDGNPVDNALFSALVHVDGLMNPGRQMQVDETGMRVANPVVAVVRNMTTPAGQLTPEDYWAIEKSPDQQQRTTLKLWLSNFQDSANGPSAATKIRVKMVDQFASVADRLQSRYEHGIRNALGEINPINFLRQAVDYKRLALQVFKLGGLRKDENGYYTAYELTDAEGNPLNPSMALDEIRALGERMGEDYAGAKARVSRVLEGMRLHEMRQFNAEQEKLARAYEALNTPEADKLADKARSEKKLLHMLNSEIDELVAAFEASPEIQRVQSILRTTRENLIDNMVTSGRLTQEAGDFWKSNINYVPFNRMEEAMATTDLTEFRGRRGISQLGSLPVLKGSYERPVANTIDNYMTTLSWMVGQVMRNDGSVRVLNAMQDAGYARKVESAAEADNAKLLSPVVYIEGEPVRYELQSELDLAAFAQADSPDGAIVNAFAFSARLLRGTITAIPTFSLNQNMQDTIRAGVQSGTRSSLRTAARTLANFPLNVTRAWRGRESESGAALHNYAVVGNYDYNPIDPLSTLEHEIGAIKQGAIGRTLRRLEQIAKASDQAAREAVYQQTMLESGDHALAVTRARELINYNRRGASRSAQVLAKTVPFFNAYAQGLDLMYRGVTGKDSPSGLGRRESRNYILGRVAMMMATGFAYAAFMSDDEDYKNANDYVRDRGWILPRAFSSLFDGADGRHTPLVIPTPREFAFFIKMIPERIVQYQNDALKGEDRLAWDAVKDILGAAKDTYLMEPTPPIIKQVIEYSTNYSTFTGRPLVGSQLEDAPARLQVNRDTSELARGIGNFFNLSPIKVDNLIQGSFGTAGALALRVIDTMANGNLPELPMNKIPGLSTFTAAEVGNRTTTDFYELRDKVNQATAAVRLLQDSPGELQDYLRTNAPYLGLQDWVQSKQQAMSDLRKMRDVIMRSDKIDMTPKERRAELLRLDKIQQQLMSDVPKIRGHVERAVMAAK